MLVLNPNPNPFDLTGRSITIPTGRHAWLWKLSDVRDWPSTFRAARYLGFSGLHLHSTTSVLSAAITRDLVARGRDAGLFIGASVAMDTGASTYTGTPRTLVGFTPTAKERFRDGILRVADLLGPTPCVGLNWEIRWETWKNAQGVVVHTHRRADAAWLATELRNRLPMDALLWDAPWRKPESHGTAPTDEFGAAMSFRVPQDYWTFAGKDAAGAAVTKIAEVPAAYKAAHPEAHPGSFMVAETAAQYARRAVKRVLFPGFQATSAGGAGRYLGACLRDWPVTFWWHFLRLTEPGNREGRAIFRALALIERAYPGTDVRAAVSAFQRAHGLTEDGWIGAEVVAKARDVFADFSALA